ncbi:MAG: InlB B-repeat-containing protein, partial [Firmicutes bacterium]|nr:InlB B-repeat-containing protein [Bacillota bacterium]
MANNSVIYMRNVTVNSDMFFAPMGAAQTPITNGRLIGAVSGDRMHIIIDGVYTADMQTHITNVAGVTTGPLNPQFTTSVATSPQGLVHTFVGGRTGENLVEIRMQAAVIHFNSRGGSAVAPISRYYPMPPVVTTTYLTLTPTAHRPIRAHFNFLGWTRNPLGTTEADVDYNPTDISSNIDVTILWGESITLYAVWEAREYNITYVNVAASEHDNPAIFTIETPTFGLNNPSNRVGWTFDGWYLDALFTQPITQVVVGTTGDFSIYAKWTAITYNLIFNNVVASEHSNPSTFTLEDFIELEGGALGLPLTGATRSGWTFLGWHDNAELTGSPVTAVTAIGHQTFWANWGRYAYNLTFTNHDNGTVFNGFANIGDTFEFPTPAARSGYRFAGWIYDNDIENPFLPDDSITIIAGFGDRNFVGRWVRVHNITFTNHDDGTTLDILVDHGGSVTLPNPTRDGRPLQGFRGWRFAGTGSATLQPGEIRTNITSNRNYVGLWTPTVDYFVPDSTAPFTGTSVVGPRINVQWFFGVGDIVTIGSHNLINPANFTAFNEALQMFNFHGWYVDGVLRQPGFTISGFVTGEPGIEIHGSWTFRNFNITYNNIEVEDTNPNPLTFSWDDFVTLNESSVLGLPLLDASRSGHTFRGWYTTSNFASGTRIFNITALENQT